MQRPLTGGIIVCLLVWMSPLVVVAMFVSKSREVLEMEYLHRSPIADTDSSIGPTTRGTQEACRV